MLTVEQTDAMKAKPANRMYNVARFLDLTLVKVRLENYFLNYYVVSYNFFRINTLSYIGSLGVYTEDCIMCIDLSKIIVYCILLRSNKDYSYISKGINN